jgi:uncharacterized protein YkwD
MRRALLFAGVLLAVANAYAVAPQEEITPDSIVAAMNGYRALAGLGPLHLESRLAMAAGDRMKHMEEAGFWSHESPEGLPPFVWLTARAYNYRAAGENLASGFETVSLLVQSWMESPGHRANILSRDYEDCGIAIIDGATTGPATGKSIVVMFASKMR